MTRYTRDEAVNALAPDRRVRRVYLYEIIDGPNSGYLTSTLQHLVTDLDLAGTWQLDFAVTLEKISIKKGRAFLFEPVPATIEVGVDGMALARAILSVPLGYSCLLRSHEQGYFANVISPSVGGNLFAGLSFKAIADTPQAALAGAVRQVGRN